MLKCRKGKSKCSFSAWLTHDSNTAANSSTVSTSVLLQLLPKTTYKGISVSTNAHSLVFKLRTSLTITDSQIQFLSFLVYKIYQSIFGLS